ncbi:NAD(P)-dependent dehydrogenase (short-subunit alcohol dehydrogenase family) [Nocardia transvalensis]|uniref:NAD(P)-dependent dehydrogenase (Short-subunit alcohol dehydrogenase family) n=1 Tax=Nocardia transvalensis TaxID=37333 RepID=A0A7W9PLI9_9NOCA|nr:SDR family NAD(P)-dependent oxidoreductase [Nocardia transvalensis]MBB5918130.1 NAD(P)-dependent dehydrogenase (short-subunit alcohol dehydrogenase family) [Nocardia transvalensis]
MTWHSDHRAEGKTFLVTGANAGIGYFVAEQLAATGATVVLGCRDTAKADLAIQTIRTRVPEARLRRVGLDLADLPSLPATVDALGVDTLDAVVLNAGILLSGPERRLDAQGHELMFATNHLGHFALVAQLAPMLSAAANSRVITVGSYAARSERLDLADPHSEHDYRPKRTYARSKLAQMLFGFELDRRLRAAGSGTAGIVTHPGGALDSLTPSRPPLFARTTAQHFRGLPACLALHGKDAAATTITRAVLDPEIYGGQLWGPRVFGLRGRPHQETPHPHMTDPDVAARLWSVSTDLTGTDPNFPNARNRSRLR